MDVPPLTPEDHERRYNYHEGKFWAIYAVLRILIHDTGIDKQALKERLQAAKEGYPGMNANNAIQNGFDEVIDNIVI